jgi:hypothetical protein
MPISVFPEDCPFSLDLVLEEDWFPGENNWNLLSKLSVKPNGSDRSFHEKSLVNNGDRSSTDSSISTISP